MSSYSVKHVTNNQALYGTTPTWDGRRQGLIYSDLFSGTIHIYTPSTKEEEIKLVEPKEDGKFNLTVSAIPCSSSPSRFLVAMQDQRMIEFDWDEGKIIKLIVKNISENPMKGMNDGKCDRKGRFWIGTQTWLGFHPLQPDLGKGELLRIEGKSGNLDITPQTEGFAVPNGLGFNKEWTKLYVSDFWNKAITVFDYDLESGTVSNRKIIFEFSNYPAFSGTNPGGLEVDINGHLWVAVWLGGAVLKIDGVYGTLLDKIEIPVKTVTSLCFGGAELNKLYVTSTSKDLQHQQIDCVDSGKLWEVMRPGDDSFKGFQHPYFLFE